MERILSLPINKFNDKGLPLDYFLNHDQRTQYERKNNLKTLGYTLVIDEPNIKIALFHKENDSDTINIYFRVGKNVDSWLRWNPQEDQAKVIIEDFPEIFKRVRTAGKLPNG